MLMAVPSIITLMAMRRASLGLLLCLACLGLSGSDGSVLGKATRVGTANLETDKGQPVTVDYYNLQGSLKAIAYKLAKERPKDQGWKQDGSDDYAVFTSSKRTGDVMWQRIAVFRGKLDRKFKAVPGTEKTWLNVVVYRVRTVRVHRAP